MGLLVIENLQYVAFAINVAVGSGKMIGTNVLIVLIISLEIKHHNRKGSFECVEIDIVLKSSIDYNYIVTDYYETYFCFHLYDSSNYSSLLAPVGYTCHAG